MVKPKIVRIANGLENSEASGSNSHFKLTATKMNGADTIDKIAPKRTLTLLSFLNLLSPIRPKNPVPK